MTNKKIAVIGRGTGGAMSVAHFKRWTDWEIEWYFDPQIQTQAVGEGSALVVPINLLNCFNFSHEELPKIDGTFKTGIAKEGWGKSGNYFFHDFPPPHISYHFNALKLQQYVMGKLQHKVKIIESNVKHDEIDADFILDCSGKPNNFEEYYKAEYIPVNSVHVTQCYWDYPKFQHSLNIAKKYGWIFGIPLQNRCSIGYLYNKDINTLDEVKEDVKEIFERYNLTPSDTTNSFHFGNYYHKQNFTDRLAYNGNASFFLEPLEATSFGMIDLINRTALDMWNNNITIVGAQTKYLNKINQIQNMIMMHYFAGSKYKTKFWEYAENRGIECLRRAKTDNNFVEICDMSMIMSSWGEIVQQRYDIDYGTWPVGSFFQNINGLDIKPELVKLLHETI